tara:strand:- start:3541 stop:4557 length:1017 start_codon:yes stop_codon:yes gene_type:complete
MATINVPADQATLALAYTAAAHGDIINLAAGTHSVPAQQDVNLEITIQGATGTASDVILASNGTYHTLHLQTGSITVKDLTITNPDATSTGTTMWFAIRSDSSSNNGYVIDNVIIVTNHCGVYGSGSTSTYNRCNISVNNIHGGYRATTGSLDGKGTWTNNRCYGHDVKYWGYMTSADTKSCSFILSPTTTYTVFSAIITSDEIFNCSLETNATTSAKGIRAMSSHTHVSLNCPNITGDFYSGTVAEANTITTAMAQASGQDLMVDAATGDAHVNPLGLAYQNGDYAKIVDPDLDGNNYNNPPSRGCYEETPAAGGGGGGAVLKSRAGFLPSPFTLTP